MNQIRIRITFYQCVEICELRTYVRRWRGSFSANCSTLSSNAAVLRWVKSTNAELPLKCFFSDHMENVKIQSNRYIALFFSSIFTNFHQFSQFSPIFTNFHQFSPIFTIFTNFHQFSPIFTIFTNFTYVPNFHQFSPI